MMTTYDQAIEEAFPRILKDLGELIAIPSHRDLSTKAPGAPFGRGIAQAMIRLKAQAEALGFSVHEEEGYALDIRTGDGEDYIGILAHIDTVEALEGQAWLSDPYVLTEREGILYGRGVNDDKGPLVACLHALKILRDKGKAGALPLRLIVGGAEETTWECMDRYFSRHPQPRWAFSPDGDFPVVNGEKGILQVRVRVSGEPVPGEVTLESLPAQGYLLEELRFFHHGESVEFRGKRALSRHPERGETPLPQLLLWLKKERPDLLQGEGALPSLLSLLESLFLLSGNDPLSLLREDPAMGSSSIALTAMGYAQGLGYADLDLRYTRIHTAESLLAALKEVAGAFGGEVEVVNHRNLLYVEADSPLIHSLKGAYQAVTKEPVVPLTKGGASYARVLQRGVAFGPTFPGEIPHSHFANEQLPVASLKKALAIWLLALEELTRGE